MTWKDQLHYWASVIANVSVILTLAVGTISLSVTTCNLRDTLLNERFSRWEEIAVYKVIERAGETGISPDDLRTKYLDSAALEKELNVPNEKLGTYPLEHIIFRLLGYGMISLNSKGNYIASTRERDYATLLTDEDSESYYKESRVTNELVDEIIGTVRAEGGKYTLESLGVLITKSDKYTQSQYGRIVSTAVSSGIITLDADGKLWSAAGPPTDKQRNPPPRN